MALYMHAAYFFPNFLEMRPPKLLDLCQAFRALVDMSGSVVDLDIDSGIVSQLDITSIDPFKFVELPDSCCWHRKRHGPDKGVKEIHVLYSMLLVP